MARMIVFYFLTIIVTYSSFMLAVYLMRGTEKVMKLAYPFGLVFVLVFVASVLGVYMKERRSKPNRK